MKNDRAVACSELPDGQRGSSPVTVPDFARSRVHENKIPLAYTMAGSDSRCLSPI